MLAFKILIMYRVINIGCLLARTGEYRQTETNPVVQSLSRLEYWESIIHITTTTFNSVTFESLIPLIGSSKVS